jgi:hypothetical protein
MSGYGVAMRRTEKQTKPEVNTCGACGVEIARTEVLCRECVKNEVDFRGFQIQSGESQ